MKASVTAFVLLALAAACSPKSADQKSVEVDHNEAKADAAIQNIVKVDGPAAVAPGVPISKLPATIRDPDALPLPLQGRWGLTAADCDVSVRAPKGLLVIAPKQLTFYEAKATIVSLDKATDYAVTAGLSFEDDNKKQWTSVETLALVTGGTALIRTEQSPVKTYRYQRCR